MWDLGSVQVMFSCSSGLEGSPEEVDFLQHPKKIMLDPAFLPKVTTSQHTEKATGDSQVLISACLYLGLLVSYL